MIYEIVKSLWPFILLCVIFIVSVFIFLITSPIRKKDKTVPVYEHKSFIRLSWREYGYWFTYPFFYVLIKLKISPNMLTAVSPFLALISGYFYFKGYFTAAGWVWFCSGVMDFLDGRVARATKQSTNEGAFFDSTIDRYSDGFVFGGIALYFRDNLFMLIMALLTILGTEVTSYAKARGEANGVSTKIGLMQRGERWTLLWLASIFYPFIMLLLNRFGITREYPIIIIMVLFAVLTNYTAIIRIVYIFKQIKSQPK